MIGVQSNHDVEYFGCPAAPTLRFSYFEAFYLNQNLIHWREKFHEQLIQSEKEDPIYILSCKKVGKSQNLAYFEAF